MKPVINLTAIDRRSQQTLVFGLLFAVAMVVVYLSLEFWQENRQQQQVLLNHYSWLRTHQQQIINAGGLKLIFVGDQSTADMRNSIEQAAKRRNLAIRFETRNGNTSFQIDSQPQSQIMTFLQDISSEGINLSAINVVRSKNVNELDLSARLEEM